MPRRCTSLRLQISTLAAKETCPAATASEPAGKSAKWLPDCCADLVKVLMRRLSCVCSAPDPYALLEALLARKLTAKMVVDFGKDKAQKWVNDKLTPKESLLASMGAEDHDFMVSMFALQV